MPERRELLRRWTVLLAALAAMLGVTSTANAHHSFGIYDASITRVFTGVVTRVNPDTNHLQIFFAVMNEERTNVERDENGDPIIWAVETIGSAQAAQQGISVSTFPRGTVFSVALHPLRSGEQAGSRASSLIVCPERTPPEPGVHCDTVEGHLVLGGDGALPAPVDASLEGADVAEVDLEAAAAMAGAPVAGGVAVAPGAVDLGFAGWLQATPVSVMVQATPWLIPGLQFIHILMIGVVFVSILMIALRVMGLMRQDQPIDDVVARFSPWMWGGLAAMAATGVLLIVGEPVREFFSFSFRFKMLLLAIGVASAVAFRYSLDKIKPAASADGAATGEFATPMKVAAAATIVLWLAIIFLGRAIAYDVAVWGELSPAAGL